MSINSDQAVFTTKYVIENNSPIVYVVHDDDGDWQFFGKEENIEEGDARVVALSAIIELDPSLNEIIEIPEGAEAWRDPETNEWVTSLPDSTEEEAD